MADSDKHSPEETAVEARGVRAVQSLPPYEAAAVADTPGSSLLSLAVCEK